MLSRTMGYSLEKDEAGWIESSGAEDGMKTGETTHFKQKTAAKKTKRNKKRVK